MEELDGEPTVTVRAPATVMPSRSEDCVCLVIVCLSTSREAPGPLPQLTCHSSEVPLGARVWVAVVAWFLLLFVYSEMPGSEASLHLSPSLVFPTFPSHFPRFSCWASALVSGLGPSRGRRGFFPSAELSFVSQPRELGFCFLCRAGLRFTKSICSRRLLVLIALFAFTSVWTVKRVSNVNDL